MAESEIEKFERWLVGKERAKKMWFRKAVERGTQRNEARAEIRKLRKLLYKVLTKTTVDVLAIDKLT